MYPVQLIVGKMKLFILYKDSFILEVLIILCYFAASRVIPVSFYCIPAVIFMLAVFPGKLLTLAGKKDFSITEKWFYVLSNAAIAYTVASTVLFLVTDKNFAIRATVFVCKIFNIVSALYLINKRRKPEAVFCITSLFIPNDTIL